MILHTETRRYRLDTQGNGLFAKLTRKEDGATAFFQGDDAATIIHTADILGDTLDGPETKAYGFDHAMSDYDDIMEAA